MPAIIRPVEPGPLSPENNRVVIQVGENTAAAFRFSAAAEAAALDAEGSASAAAGSAATAEAASGPTYPNVAAGLADTSGGEGFAVDNGDGTVTVYLNNGGAAVEQRTLATVAYLASGDGAGLVGFHQADAAAVDRTALDKMREVVSVQDFGALGDDVADDSDAFQAAIDYACAHGAVLTVPAGRYRITKPLVYTHNFFYSGAGAWLVKDFVSVGFQDALFTNLEFNSLTKTKNVMFRDLWATDRDATCKGSFITLVTGDGVLIDGLVTRKKAEGWNTVLAADNIRIANCDIFTEGNELFSDCIHITQGHHIVISNCLLRSASDDSLALHPHQDTWSVNGQFSGISDVVIDNCVMHSATNSFRAGFSDTGGDGEYDFPVGDILVSNCILRDGAQLRDDRTSLNVAPIGPIKFVNCTFGDDVLVRSPTGTTRFGRLGFAACKFKDIATGHALDLQVKSVDVLTLDGCEITGTSLLAANSEIRIRNTDIRTSATGTACVLTAPRIVLDGGSLIGAGTEFRGFMLANGGSAVPYAAIKNFQIENVTRGIDTSDGVTFLDAEGTTFEDNSVVDISTNIADGRWCFSALGSWNPGSISPGASETTNLSVRGARVGDTCIAAFTPISSNDLVVTARVSAANIVAVTLRNFSGGAIDPAAGTIRARVWR